ncbi:MAG: LytR C-terminal domain-containing protein [Actinomycetota bacterium]|nr:LytR C-terminal domain-containing protein [Actinomycetota bacterium]
MDHPLVAPDHLVRPWRLAAYIAGAVAVAELLLLLVIGGGALIETVSDRVQVAARERALAPSSPARQATTRKPTPIAAIKTPRGRTVVMVLNGNGRTGAAASAASVVRNRGYRIGAVGNAPRTDFPRSLVMFKPGFAGEGRRLARDLGVKQFGPLDGVRARELGRAQLVFILGA